MKLSKFYSNLPDLFSEVRFAPGINVVLAEIRLPENLNKDTHNLGKSTFGRLIDFAFLKGKEGSFFLFKHQHIFSPFVFFLEVQLPDSSFLTIRRSVEEASKIAFKKHFDPDQNFSNLHADEWDHFNVPFDRAKQLLDALLDWRGLKPYDFRSALGYLLRSQDDYKDVFQLKKFAGPHADWKPILARLLGFDYVTITDHYAKQALLAKKDALAATLRAELVGTSDDASKIDGLLLLKRREIEKKQELMDAFDFRSADNATTALLVDELDDAIASLNARRYSLTNARSKINKSLSDDKILFDPDDASRLFKEAGILFAGQIKKEFNQLIAFNRAITEERRGYLEQERREIDEELQTVSSQLNALGEQRSVSLRYLSETDALEKYKALSSEIVTLKADILSLERQREFLQRLQDLRNQTRALKEEIAALQGKIEANVQQCSSSDASVYTLVRLYFNDIVRDVIDCGALLSVSVNGKGHLEFRVDILDEAGNETSAALGTTYRKLLCIAFDMALLRSHLRENFPRFVYHDGVFETLDPRKKAKLHGILRQYADLGLQLIMT